MSVTLACPPATFHSQLWWGDFNGDGKLNLAVANGAADTVSILLNNCSNTTPGVYDPANAGFFLRNSNTGGIAEITFTYGPAGMGFIPLVGDGGAFKGTASLQAPPGTTRCTIGDRNTTNNTFSRSDFLLLLPKSASVSVRTVPLMKPFSAKKTNSSDKSESICRRAVFWLTVSLLVLIPLSFNTKLHRTYAIPKLVLLLVGASALIPLIALSAVNDAYHRDRSASLFRSRHVMITGLYILVVLSSTIFSSDPITSLFGHFYNQMGLITRFGFFVCFIGIIDGIDLNPSRLEKVLWAMIFAGLLVSTYAVAQFFGYDPFVPSVLYTSDSPEGAVVRVVGTLGHADYLGNFLLYTTALSAALAITARGLARVIASIATALSTVAIICSGTRGAWVGLISGAVVFSAPHLRKGGHLMLRTRGPRVMRWALLTFVVVLVFSLAISLSPASRSIVTRAGLTFREGFTGAGRSDLWRDSIKMVPAFALTGSGPDNFRRAFLPYKSKELGRKLSINSESSHNSYLDAAISFGVPGFVLYVVILVSTFRLLLGARRRTTDYRMRVIIVGIISSLAAVAVHNFFIFDQIPTGLYFFAFAALAQVVSNIVRLQDTNPPEASDQETRTPIQISTKRKAISEAAAPALAKSKQGRPTKSRQSFVGTERWVGRATAAIGCALVAIAAWYSAAIVHADAAIDRAMMSADAGDLAQVISNGERAADSAEITGEYNFLFARALVLCADRVNVRSTVKEADAGGLIAARNQAIELAAARAQKSLAHTFTPDVNYLFLAYLALVTNDVVELRAYAQEAVSWDQNHFRTRWMLAEAYLASGDRNRAAQEAEIALDLNPTSSEAKSVIARARGETTFPATNIEEIIARALKKSEAGKISQARRLLDRAFRLSNGQCPECHRALALVYEAGNEYENAIAEWQIFAREDPSRAATEEIASRIEALGRKR